MTRVLIVTPLLRSYGRAIVAAHRLIKAAPCPVEWLILTEQPHAGYDYRNVLHANTRARDAALGGDFTHLLFLEDDIVPPPDALSGLLACETDVAYSLYCLRRAGHEWSAYMRLELIGGISLSSGSPEVAARAFLDKAILKVPGVGFGCTLISRQALAAVPFRLPEQPNGGACTDWLYAVDIAQHGFTQACNFGVTCGHISMEPTPRVIWPIVDDDGAPSHRLDYFEAS